MTASYSPEASAAVRALGRFVASTSGREQMRQNGYASGSTMIPMNHMVTMSEVLDRVQRHGFPVSIAVHFPEREGVEQLNVVAFHGLVQRDSPLDVDEGITIGMLADSLRVTGPTSVRISIGVHATAYMAHA